MDSHKMMDEINEERRRFFGAVAMAGAATQLGMIGTAAAQETQTTPAIAPSCVTATAIAAAPRKRRRSSLIASNILREFI